MKVKLSEIRAHLSDYKVCKRCNSLNHRRDDLCTCFKCGYKYFNAQTYVVRSVFMEMKKDVSDNFTTDWKNVETEV